VMKLKDFSMHMDGDDTIVIYSLEMKNQNI